MRNEGEIMILEKFLEYIDDKFCNIESEINKLKRDFNELKLVLELLKKENE